MPTYLEHLNWQEFRDTVPGTFPTALVPIGTIEAHGVGPLGTDNMIPIDLARAIADDCQALICPPIHYGLVKGLAGYPGSVRVSSASFEAYVVDVLNSLAEWGFSNAVILNGHGGNTGALKNAAWSVHAKTGMRILSLDWWQLADSVCQEVYGQAGGHAGCDENGYVQAIHPETIHPERMDDDLVYNFHPAAAVYPYPGPVITYKPGEGAPVFDDDKAKRYREGAIDKVREFVVDVLRRWEKHGG